MSRKIIFGLVLSVLLLIGFGCSNSSAKNGKLYIYNWTYYIPEEVVKDFEKETGIDVIYDEYASNEEMFAKLQGGASGYDLVFPSQDFVSIMIAEGMLQPIDKSKIPNFSNIDPAIIRKVNFDSGNTYSVPYMVGTAGVAVNKTAISGYDKSWSIFDNPAAKGKSTLLDDMRHTIGAALRFLGYSVNSTDPEELAKAKAVLQRWTKNIVRFDAESQGKGFAAGEFQIVHTYAENVFAEMDESKYGDVDFFIPKEGAAMYMDNFVILKDAKNVDNALAFINHCLKPEVNAKILDYIGYPSIVPAATPLRTGAPNYTLEDMANCEFFLDLGDKIELYNQIWQSLHIGE